MARHSLREDIVEAALEQFHSHGYNAAGVKDITDRAGVPKGSFYNHFDSKEALAVVALERYAERRRLEDLADRSVAPLARLPGHFELLRAEAAGGDPAAGQPGKPGAEDVIGEDTAGGAGGWPGAVVSVVCTAQPGTESASAHSSPPCTRPIGL